MARPRKWLLPSTVCKEITIELVEVPANTLESEKRLQEAFELVAHFISLGMKKKKIAGKEDIKNAA